MVKTADLPTFEVAEYLDDEASIAAYLTAILEEDNIGLLAEALDDVAKARGMTQFEAAEKPSIIQPRVSY